MTAEGSSSRLQIAQQVASHIGQRDFDQFIDLLAPDVEYRVGGNYAIAGTYRGPDEVTAHVRELVDRTDGTFESVKWEDWLVGENHVAALVIVHAQGHGAVVATRLIFMLGFNAADKVTEITLYFEDPGSVERFFGR